MYQKEIEAYWNDPAREQELVDAISRLVGVKSVKGEAEPGKPFGPGPAAALTEALSLCKELGFAVTDYDHYVGLADLNDKETRLHILGHLDVVGEGSGWSTDPYTCVERDGMLYGRGVSDDKGPVVCALLVLSADWLFFYYMPGYAGAGERFLWVVLPSALMTAPGSWLLHCAVRRISTEFKIDNGVV